MDSDEDHEDSTQSYRGVPATVILINVLDYKTAEIAHAATCRLVRQYLRQSGAQYVSVCLFGTELDDGETSLFGDKYLLEIFPLTMPSLEDFKKLQNTRLSSLKQSKELKLSNVLIHCSKLFANCKKTLSSRTIVMLLKLDNPPIQIDQIPTLKKVEDMVEDSVDIKLINVSETDYTPDQFFVNFLINARKRKDVIVPKPIWDVKDIENNMYRESNRHLAVAKINFEIGNDISIGVGIYSLLKDSRHTQKSTYLDRDTSEIVTPVTQTLKLSNIENEENQSQTTEVPLLKSELIFYQEYGGQKVEFTDSEMKYMKNPFGPPMFKLLGFKPASLLSMEKWFLKKGYFLFPNDETIDGSTIAFRALHKACIETGMIAICILCTRVNSRPVNVALSPCTHPLHLDIDTGFDIINIPFVENVRHIPEVVDDKEVNISDAHKTVMKDTVKSVMFDYKPDMFEDPKQQSLYRTLEALALDDEDLEPFVDTTKPNSEMFSNLNDDLFNELFGPFGVTNSAGVKRQTGARYEGSSKRAKTENGEIDESLLQNRLSKNKVNQYTVAELKLILKSKDIPQMPALTGLKKAELVELVYANFP